MGHASLSCRACGARQELAEAQIAALAIDLGGRVRCPACGAFAARLLAADGTVQPAPVMPTVPPLQDLGEPGDDGWAGRALRLRRGNRVFRVRDLDRLRRLVVLRKAGASDLVSADGVRWVPVASLPALGPFLSVVRHLDERDEVRVGPVLVEATAAELGWSGSAADHVRPSAAPADAIVGAMTRANAGREESP